MAGKNTEQKENAFGDLIGEEQKLAVFQQNSKQLVKADTRPEEPKAAVQLNGWRPIEEAPHNGMPCYISNSLEEEGVLAFWRRTRAFANATKRWLEYGKFVDYVTGADIPFKPVFFRNRF